MFAGFKVGTLSSDNRLLAEPLSSGGCSEGCSESAATSVFSGKIHPDSTGRWSTIKKSFLGGITSTTDSYSPKATEECFSLFYCTGSLLRKAQVWLAENFIMGLRTSTHVCLVSLLSCTWRLFCTLENKNPSCFINHSALQCSVNSSNSSEGG